jgi:hypothetical protein
LPRVYDQRILRRWVRIGDGDVQKCPQPQNDLILIAAAAAVERDRGVRNPVDRQLDILRPAVRAEDAGDGVERTFCIHGFIPAVPRIPEEPVSPVIEYRIGDERIHKCGRPVICRVVAVCPGLGIRRRDGKGIRRRRAAEYDAPGTLNIKVDVQFGGVAEDDRRSHGSNRNDRLNALRRCK